MVFHSYRPMVFPWLSYSFRGGPGHFGTHDKSHFGTHREVSVKGHFGTQREPDKDQFGTHTDLWNTRGLGGVGGGWDDNVHLPCTSQVNHQHCYALLHICTYVHTHKEDTLIASYLLNFPVNINLASMKLLYLKTFPPPALHQTMVSMKLLDLNFHPLCAPPNNGLHEASLFKLFPPLRSTKQWTP